MNTPRHALALLVALTAVSCRSSTSTTDPTASPPAGDVAPLRRDYCDVEPSRCSPCPPDGCDGDDGEALWVCGDDNGARWAVGSAGDCPETADLLGWCEWGMQHDPPPPGQPWVECFD